MKSVKKIVCIILAFFFFFIGAIGAVVPVLPTTPFLLLSSFFFVRGSDRFNKWFLSTKLYKTHLESFVKSRSMTLKTKVKLLAFASTMLIISFVLIDIIYARMCILCVIAYKYYYFIFKIETVDDDKGRIKKVDEHPLR